MDNMKEVQVYLELGGKSNQHSSLSGRDEANQHSISAITNLQNILDNIAEHFSDNDIKINVLEQSKNSIELEISNIKNEQRTCIKLKGEVPNTEYLPRTNLTGDVYKTTDEPNYYIWNGSKWDFLGGVANLKNYATMDYVNASMVACVLLVKQYLDEHLSNIYSKEQVDFLLNYKANKDEIYSKDDIDQKIKDQILSTTWITYEDIIG